MLKKFLSQTISLTILLFFSSSFYISAQEIQQPKKKVELTQDRKNNTEEKDNSQNENQKTQKADNSKTENILKKKKFKSDEIIITATKNEIDKKETGASVSIITGEEIAESGKNMVSDVLRIIPGVDVVSSGSLGATSLIGIRGSSSKNVLVLIDGVPVNDPIGGGGDKTFDFANFPTDNIERIEIVRGPSSVLYGSEAAAGVINIITKKREGKPEIRLSVEGGSYLTFQEKASITASTEILNFSFSATRIDSEGMTKRANPDGSITALENDPYHNTALSSRTRIKLFDSATLDFNIHYINSEAATDQTSGDTPFSMFYNELFSTGLVFNQNISFWDHKLALSYTSSNTKDVFDPLTGYFSHSYFNGQNQKIDWLNNFNINTENIKDTISIGISGSNDMGSTVYASNSEWGLYTSAITEKSVSSLAVYIQNHFKLFNRLFFIAGGRYDYNQYYKSDFNYNFSLSGIIPVVETRIKANLGTGFKAPTLYQTYDGSYGNRSLLPEKNFSFDAGFEQPFFKDMILFSIVYFNSEYTNMISYDFTTSKFINIGKAYMQGLESELILKLPENINISAGYTFTKANAAGSDAQLGRRPMHKIFAKINWSFLKRGNVNIAYAYYSESVDTVAGAYPAIYTFNASYHKLDLAASFWIIDSVQIFVKLNNITNSWYQEANGYAMPGFNGSGGVTVKL